MIDELNKFAQEVYQNAKDKGFHDDDDKRSLVENYAIWLKNIDGESAELWEAVRKGEARSLCDKWQKMNDAKLQALSCEEEELADIIIRALDTAVARGINIGWAMMIKHEFNKTRSYKHGGKLV